MFTVPEAAIDHARVRLLLGHHSNQGSEAGKLYEAWSSLTHGYTILCCNLSLYQYTCIPGSSSVFYSLGNSVDPVRMCLEYVRFNTSPRPVVDEPASRYAQIIGASPRETSKHYETCNQSNQCVSAKVRNLIATPAETKEQAEVCPCWLFLSRLSGSVVREAPVTDFWIGLENALQPISPGGQKSPLWVLCVGDFTVVYRVAYKFIWSWLF
ncbi:MAG: hypothetical protein J3Q66DRAFT_366848 [Benniella sp.]|nr:MAG: hypothetical protein J3Q66DRAFT_366848 [Benniella sp.]